MDGRHSPAATEKLAMAAARSDQELLVLTISGYNETDFGMESVSDNVQYSVWTSAYESILTKLLG